MPRLLVTGLHGFVGRTLAGMVASEPSLAGWTLCDVPVDFQILDAGATERLVCEAAPDAVLHLAALSSVANSKRDPEATLQVNFFGTLRLLQALKKCGSAARMVMVSSSDIYGAVAESSLPISEALMPAPRNPYAVSKLAAEALCYEFAVTEGIHVTIARPFNHIGPGQADEFAVPNFARQLEEIRRGVHAPIVEVGDIDVTRDFTDVRDIVRAYFALLEHGSSGERYNVCSGQERTLRSLLETMIELAGVQVEIRQDAARFRPAEQRRAVGDASKIHAATGWRAGGSIREALAAVLDEARNNG